MTDKILFIDDIQKLTRLSRPTIDKYIKLHTFPKPSKVGPRLAWYESDINNWLSEQMRQG